MEHNLLSPDLAPPITRVSAVIGLVLALTDKDLVHGGIGTHAAHLNCAWTLPNYVQCTPLRQASSPSSADQP